MSILDFGLDKRVLKVAELSSADQGVMNAEALFDKYFAEIAEIVRKDNESLGRLEDAVNQLRYTELEAGYRVGIADGMQLQQEVNALMNVRG